MQKTAAIMILVLGLAAIALLLLRGQRAAVPPVVQAPTEDTETPAPTVVSGASLSSDRKAILIDGEAALRIDDPAIKAYLRDPGTFLCDSANIGNTPTRRAYCTDDGVFADRTSFTEIVTSPQTRAVGFAVQSEELEPDTAIGIFLPANTTYRVHFLTTYYLGNDFISFSPSGSRFVYRERCFEAACGLTIKQTNTLDTVRRLGNPELEPNHEFIRWLSDNHIEYRVGTEVRQLAL